MNAIETPPPAIGPESSPKPARRRWPWVIGGLLLAGSLGLLFLPQIASQLFRQQQTLDWLTADLPANLEVGDANLSWQTPVELKNVIIRTPEGKPLASVASITSQKTLWQMLTNREQPLQLNLNQFKVGIIVPDPKSRQGRLNLANVARTLQSFKMAKPARAMIVTIDNGQLDFRDPDRELIDSWRQVQAVYRYEAGDKPRQTLELKVPGTTTSPDSLLELNGRWEAGDTRLSTETFSIMGRGADVSLTAANPWLNEYLGDQHSLASCGGTLDWGFERRRDQGWTMSLQAELAQGAGEIAGGVQTVAYQEQDLADVRLNLQTGFSKTSDELSIGKLQLAADNVAVDVQGKISELSSREVIDLSGEVDSPGLSLVDLLPPSLQQEVELEEVRFSDMSVRGALRPDPSGERDPLELSVVAHWKHAAAYGLRSRNGRLRLSYRDGQLTSTPEDVPLNGGRLTQLPVLNLRTTPAVLRFGSGVYLDNIELSEEVCRDWLKYISPMLANATTAEGRLTLAISEGALPVGEYKSGSLLGDLRVHGARVKPGPLALRLLEVVSQLQMMVQRGDRPDYSQQTWMAVDEEAVRFALHDGRVTHDRFGFRVGDARVWTTGGVDLQDDSLGLGLAMEIPERWTAGGGPLVTALRGEVVELAVRGTMDRPEVDLSPLADFGKRAGLKAGAGLLQRLLERRLNR